MTVKTISVKVPERTWGRLATIADNRGVLITDLLAEALDAVLASPGGRVSPESVVCPLPHKPAPLPRVEGRLQELVSELRAARAEGYRSPSSRSQGALKGQKAGSK